MIYKERCFTVKEAAKLLGVSTTTVKRRVKSKELITEERIGRRGLELVIPQRALNLELMSFVPAVHKLTLSDFEVIVVKRFEAMAAGSDQSVSNALRDLRKEYAQLTAELNGCQTVFWRSYRVASRRTQSKVACEAEAQSDAIIAAAARLAAFSASQEMNEADD